MSVAERTRRERLYIRGDEHFSALRADKKTSLRHSFRSRACKMIFGGIDVFHTGNIPRFSENSNCFRKNFPELPLPRACADSPERRHPILQAPQAFLLRTSADKPLSSSGLTCLFNKKTDCGQLFSAVGNRQIQSPARWRRRRHRTRRRRHRTRRGRHRTRRGRHRTRRWRHRARRRRHRTRRRRHRTRRRRHRTRRGRHRTRRGGRRCGTRS